MGVGPTPRKRAARDTQTPTLQENRAKAVIAWERAARTHRFVTVKNGTTTCDEEVLPWAWSLVGLKGVRHQDRRAAGAQR